MSSSTVFRISSMILCLIVLCVTGAFGGLKEDIVGTWSGFVPEGGFVIVTFNPDGTYEVSAKIGEVILSVEKGTYAVVSETEMTLTITESDDPDEVGKSSRATDVSISGDTLSFFDPEFRETLTFTRGIVEVEPPVLEGTGVVSGRAEYTGPLSYRFILILLVKPEVDEPPAALTLLTKPGEYRIINVPEDRYIAIGVLTNTFPGFEPLLFGVCGDPTPITVSAGSETTGIDINIDREMSEFFLVFGPPSSVESTTWGRIKSEFKSTPSD